MPDYDPTAFLGEKPFCDAIMKGGITSGVVYPLAVVELATRFRLKNIGGASAGAIAAAFTAAAEYSRATDGFPRLQSVAEEVSKRVLSLFQPTPGTRAVFGVAVEAVGRAPLRRKIASGIVTLAREYPGACAVGLLPGLVLALLLAQGGRLWVGTAVLFILGSFGSLLAVAGRAACVVLRELNHNGFGFCPGRRQEGFDQPALSDWLADEIDRVAGIQGKPLTFGDLSTAGINLEIMTTDLASLRPYRIPFDSNLFLFRTADLDAVFPPRITQWMVDHSNAFEPDPEYRWLPYPENLPVVFAVRLSLSFPILLAAVPLYARDFTFAVEAEAQKPRRCWFSDGGICSNFPIHFFDAIWPQWPTFGITLEPFVEGGRHPRVWLPENAGQGILRPFAVVRRVGEFFAAMIDAMQSWRDNLQSTLGGYRGRIVHIQLEATEGGLNLDMDPATVANLMDLGRQAGSLLCSQFDWDAHRWTRYLIAMAKIEEQLDELARAYDEAPPGGESLRDFLRRYAAEPASYRQSSAWVEEALLRTQRLAESGSLKRTVRLRDGEIPKPNVDLRITPKV